MSKMTSDRQRLPWGVALALAGVIAIPNAAQAATEAAKQAAINKGLEYLASTQLINGNWSYSGYDPSATGAAVLSFLEKGYKPGDDVVFGTTHYGDVVGDGLNYLLSTASTFTIGNDPYPPAVPPPPGGSGYYNGKTGIYWASEDTYQTGLVLSALAKVPDVNAVGTTSGPLANLTYKQIIQGTVDYFAWGQNGSNTGSYQGSWGYGANYYSGDNSTSQWPVIGALFAQQAGVATPQFVKDELKPWIAYIQNPNGGSGYNGPNVLVNEAKTGGLLLEMVLAGKDVNGNPFDPNAAGNPEKKALDYLNINWQTTANSTWDGNFGQPYAMWSIYKGLQSTIGLNDTTHITNLGSCGTLDPGVQCNWYQNYNESLVSTQNPGGSWNGYAYWTGPLATAWNVSILSATEIVPEPPKNVPEPSGNAALLGLGMLGLGVTVRRQLRK
jgi:hypothetical protein